MRTLVQQVASCRDKAQEAKDALSDARRRFEEEHFALIEAAQTAQAALSDAEALLREEARREFERTGDKKPGPGVAIRLLKRPVYEDQAALSWAMEHKLCLQLDRKAFEKVAVDLEFVGVREEAQVTIATDLAAALGGER